MKINRPYMLLVALTVLGISLPSAPTSAQIIQLTPPTEQGPAEGDTPTSPPSGMPSTMMLGRQSSGLDIEEARGLTAQRKELLPLRLERLSTQHTMIARLTGESARENLIVFLPEGTDATELELAYRSGIDTLPDRSSLRVTVNGTDLGEIQPASFQDFTTVRFPVPDGVLRTGPNAVDISVRHTHRIACGADASFTLWTEIDLRNSGIRLHADRFTLGPDGFIAAVAAQAARGAPVTFHRPDPEQSMLDAAPFIASAAIALGGTPPKIISAPYWVAEEAVPQLARITAFPPGEGPQTPEFRRGGDGAIVLVLEQSDNYDAVLGALFPEASVMPRRGPALLQPGAPHRLTDIGISHLRGEGRYLQLNVDFMLPWDWMLLASQRARLDLDYRFADGLPAGALLLVKINGTTIRLLPLDRDGGQGLPTLPISFAARLLNAGVNRLEFEALIPGAPPDMACPPLVGPILEVSATSQIYVPASPRMTQPSLERTLAALSPRNIELSQSALSQFSPGLVPQLAAALLVAPAETRLTDEGAVLHVGVLSDLDQLQTQYSRSAIRALFQAMGIGLLPGDSPQSDGTPWETVSSPRGRPGQLGLSEIGSLPRRAVDTLIGLVRGETPALNDWLADKEAQVALLQPDPRRPQDIWLILSPNIDPSNAVTALAASRLSHNGPRGQVALYSDGRGWVSWTSPDRPLSLNDAPAMSNIRAIMGNYATTAPLPFISALLGLTLFSAAVALAVLLLSRRRSK